MLHITRKTGSGGSAKRLTVSEKLLESRFRAYAKKLGCKFIKMQFGEAGMPDRMLLIPGGKAWFIEFKTTGKVPRKLQAARLKELSRLGFFTAVIDDNESYIRIITKLDYEVLC